MPIPYDPTPAALFQPELRPTVFGAAPLPGIEALAVEAARLAYVRFETSQADAERLAADLAKAGFAAPTPFNDSATDSQGFGALRDDGLGLLAFRGTQADRLRDLLTDLLFRKEDWPLGAGRVHHGFRAAALGLWPQVEAWLGDAARARSALLVCGHSLGAAIATLLAVPAGATHLVTIGSPRVGDAAFAAAVGAAPMAITRIVDFEDVVARVPPSFLPFHYRHLGAAVLIDGEGRRIADTAAADADVDLEDAAAAGHALLGGGELPRALTDHAPVNYLRAFWL